MVSLRNKNKIFEIFAYFLPFLGIAIGLFTALKASAHEAYVLPAERFQAGLNVYSAHPFAPLLDTSHLKLTIIITIAIVAAYVLNFLWAATKPAAKIDLWLKKGGKFGPLLIRLVVGISFFYSAQSRVMLGPELSLSYVHAAHVVQFLEYMISLMFLFGIFTELAAVLALVLFFYMASYFGGYMITYANYFAEFLVLILFGSRVFSFDRLIFGVKTLWNKAEKYAYLEVPIVRVLYGVALIYAGYTIKFAHQQLTIDVYNQYHLEYFFHNSAAFIAAGAGVSEIAIGLFVLLGFATRLTVLVSLVFITLSLAYFHELLWPHYLLYGISISLLINGAGAYSLDHAFVAWIRRNIYRKKEVR